MAGPAWHGISINAVEDKPARDNFRAINLYLRSVSKSLAGGTAEAPADGLPAEPYVIIGSSGGLSQARTLAVSAPITLSDGGAGGSVTIGASLVVPAFVLGTVAAAGSAGSLVRSDATIELFDTTAPADSNAGAAVVGVVAKPPRRDHKHLVTTASPSGGHAASASIGTATSLLRSDAIFEFATALQSAANSFTLTLTDDGTRSILTDSNDLLRFGSAGTGIDTAGTPHLGIGDNPNVNARVRVAAISTSGQPSTAGLVFAITSAVNSTSNVHGILGTASIGNNQPCTGVQAGLISTNSVANSRDNTCMTALWFPLIGSGGTTNIYMFRARISAPDIGSQTVTNWYGLKVEDPEPIISGTDITNLFGVHSKARAVFENSAARTGAGENVLTLNQLDTTTANTAHILFNDKTADPATPVEGQLWRNANDLKLRGSANTQVVVWEGETQTLSGKTLTDTFVSDGNGLVIGHTAQIDFGAIPEFQILGTGAADSSMGFARFSSNAGGATLRFLKSRSGTLGTNIIVQDGDELGRIRFQAADGGDFNTNAAEISVEVDGTPGANDMPGRLLFSTTLDGASSVTERMRIDNAGNVGIGTQAPSTHLEVEGSGVQRIRVESTDDQAGIEFISDSTNAMIIYSPNTSDDLRVFGTADIMTWQRSTGNVGIGTTGPDALLHVNGAAHFSAGQTVDLETVTTTSATLGNDDYVILVDDDTAGSTVTITLPAAASHTGREYHIKKLGTTANVVVDGNASETIDGGTTATLTTQYESISIVCDGSNWSII